MNEPVPNAGPPPQPPSTLSRLRGRLRCVLIETLAALLPKCLICVVGYLSFVSGLGVTTRELCGVDETGFPLWQDATTLSLGLGFAVMGSSVFWVTLKNRVPVSGRREVKR